MAGENEKKVALPYMDFGILGLLLTLQLAGSYVPIIATGIKYLYAGIGLLSLGKFGYNSYKEKSPFSWENLKLALLGIAGFVMGADLLSSISSTNFVANAAKLAKFINPFFLPGIIAAFAISSWNNYRLSDKVRGVQVTFAIAATIILFETLTAFTLPFAFPTLQDGLASVVNLAIAITGTIVGLGVTFRNRNINDAKAVDVAAQGAPGKQAAADSLHPSDQNVLDAAKTGIEPQAAYIAGEGEAAVQPDPTAFDPPIVPATNGRGPQGDPTETPGGLAITAPLPVLSPPAARLAIQQAVPATPQSSSSATSSSAARGDGPPAITAAVAPGTPTPLTVQQPVPLSTPHPSTDAAGAGEDTPLPIQQQVLMPPQQ